MTQPQTGSTTDDRVTHAGDRLRVLLVTNDFPPTVGGIQTYLRDYVNVLSHKLGGDSVVVFASTQDRDRAAEFDAQANYTVERWNRRVMLPTPAIARRMQELIRTHNIDVVWFGAAAPLAAMAPAARAAGARRIIASTHGHEVGWSMFPGARTILRRIGRSTDCLTYVSRYARNRMSSAFGPEVAWEPMPGGVNSGVFTPDPEARNTLRARYGLGNKKVIVAVSRVVPRKGQDTLITALPDILSHHPDAHLLIVGPGEYATTLQHRVDAAGLTENVTFTGPVDFSELPGHFCAGDVFALPVRTQAGGLSVEGLGIVFLEAQACGVATVAGNGGGAPETVHDGVTGIVVDGTDPAEVAQEISELLEDEGRRHRLAENGRNHVKRAWNWEVLGEQLLAVIEGDGRIPPRHSWNFPLEAAYRTQ